MILSLLRSFFSSNTTSTNYAKSLTLKVNSEKTPLILRLKDPVNQTVFLRVCACACAFCLVGVNALSGYPVRGVHAIRIRTYTYTAQRSAREYEYCTSTTYVRTYRKVIRNLTAAECGMGTVPGRLVLSFLGC